MASLLSGQTCGCVKCLLEDLGRVDPRDHYRDRKVHRAKLSRSLGEVRGPRWGLGRPVNVLRRDRRKPGQLGRGLDWPVDLVC